MIKLSDYVAQFISSLGVDTVFAVSGGASLHLIHSMDACSQIKLVCTHHEQSAAMAADGYARAKGSIGVAVSTSGPGATNLITGICCSFYDSVPVLYIFGQVSTFRGVGDTKVRQIGFQETPTVDICRPITKYVVGISDPMRIRYELEKAVALMSSGRPGPAVIDIPDNLQREVINEDELVRFDGLPKRPSQFPAVIEVKAGILAAIAKASRPVVIAGWGVHVAGMEKEFREFVEMLNTPVALTWAAADLLPESHPLNIGRFGTHGMRHANFSVQNADLIISLGSRLDTKATGSPINTFARAAKKIMIDIDPTELAKFKSFGLNLDVLVQADLREFFCAFSGVELCRAACQSSDWLAHINQWREEFNGIDSSIRNSNDVGVNPYKLMRQLSEIVPQDATVMVDTGCSIAWSMQAWQFRGRQRLFHDFNNTAMGWSLPAAIGAWFANGSTGPLVCVVGDGSFMMNLQELATIKHHAVPIKIILINNGGYAMIRQTQDQWLGSCYVASSNEGLSFPDFEVLSKSFGLSYTLADSDTMLFTAIRGALETRGAVLCEVRVPQSARVIPQVKFGRPNEDMEPLLPRKLFDENMLIDRI